MSSTNWSSSLKLCAMWSNSATRIDDIIVRSLTSLVGRSPTFDNAIYLLSRAGPTEGAFIMSIFWWYWFRQTNASTAQRTREHLLCTMVAGAVGLFAARFLALTL